jgi:hypothetical protein
MSAGPGGRHYPLKARALREDGYAFGVIAATKYCLSMAVT